MARKSKAVNYPKVKGGEILVDWSAKDLIDWAGVRSARVKQDPILEYHRDGSIDQEQFVAADEIRAVWESLGRGLVPQAGDMEPKIKADGPYAGPLEKLPASVAPLYLRRWRPWANQLKQEALTVRRRAGARAYPHLSIAILAIAERQTRNDICQFLGGRKSDTMEQVEIIIFDSLKAWVSLA